MKQKSLKVKIKKLSPKAIIPSYAKEGDAGLDLVAVDREFTPDYVEYKTGLAIEIPEGYVGLMFPRSSISKYSLILANAVGVIDSGYRGEICARFKRTNFIPDQPYMIQQEKIYELGDKVVQLVIVPYPKISLIESGELSDSHRSDGGFGSTGK